MYILTKQGINKMQAIQVKFLPATNTKSERIKAMCSYEDVTINWDNNIEYGKNFANGAMALLKKIEHLKGAWLGAELPNNDYAFVCIERDCDLCVGVPI